MSPSRFQLEGSSLSELTTRVAAEYGPHARIIAAEAVTSGGIQGFFAQRHYEVTVEVPEDTAQDAHSFDLPSRAGIAALLDDADNADVGIVPVVRRPQVSTASVDFATIIADLTANTVPPPSLLVPRGPTPLTGDGDLVLVVGLSDDPLRIAREMIAVTGSGLRVAGSLSVPGVDSIHDRRSILAARASGVAEKRSVLVAFGLRSPTLDFATSETLGRIHADQVWVVVDASRKEADTTRWISAVKAAVSVDGLVARNREFTSTPESVNEFDLPVGWAEEVQ